MPMFIDGAGLALSPQGSAFRQQYGAVVNMRRANDAHEAALAVAGGLEVNAARIPAETWLDFDTQTKALMLSDEGGVLLNDLMPLARNVNIGKIVSEYRRYSADEFEVRSSVDGQHDKPVNHGAYEYDGALVLVHSTQVSRIWRQLEGMRDEGYDALIEDQAVATRYVMKRTVDNFVNGTPKLTYKGYKAYGIKNNPNTQALNLAAAGGIGVNLTDPAITYTNAQKAFVTALKVLTGDANNATGNVTFYVSDAIWFNLMRPASPDSSNLETMLTVLLRTPGIAAIKKTDAVTGNQFLAMVLRSDYIRPVVGMPVTTTPITRVTPMDDFHALVWGASGIQVRADGQGRSGVLYASGV